MQLPSSRNNSPPPMIEMRSHEGNMVSQYLHQPVNVPPTPHVVSMNNLSIPSRPHSQPNEIFVGNLSYFCDEVHLYELFNQYAHVTNVRVVRTEDRSRSLLFGFVAFRTSTEMNEMTSLLNNHLFMGRVMKVEPSDRKSPNKPSNKGFQVHVAITSCFPVTEVPVKPTETLLRKVFLDYGTIIDLQVNVYFANQIPGKQEGYAFLTFSDEACANAVIATGLHFAEGLTMLCTKPQRDTNPFGINKSCTPPRVPSSQSHMMQSNRPHNTIPYEESKRDFEHSGAYSRSSGGHLYPNMHYPQPSLMRSCSPSFIEDNLVAASYQSGPSYGAKVHTRESVLAFQTKQDEIRREFRRKHQHSVSAALFESRNNQPLHSGSPTPLQLHCNEVQDSRWYNNVIGSSTENFDNLPPLSSASSGSIGEHSSIDSGLWSSVGANGQLDVFITPTANTMGPGIGYLDANDWEY